MIGLLDNYDSFTYNVAQAISQLGREVSVVKNDASLDELTRLPLKGLVISPGPGTPADSGITLEALRFFSGKLPILGICLGHQAIGEVSGGRVIRAPKPVHGKASPITHDKSGIFHDLTPDFLAGRYHSLIVEEESLPDCLKITARSPEGLIMGLEHRTQKIFGVQFHPESILTPEGNKLIANFLAHCN